MSSELRNIMPTPADRRAKRGKSLILNLYFPGNHDFASEASIENDFAVPLPAVGQEITAKKILIPKQFSCDTNTPAM
jgi:hypothetical protein